MKKQNLQQVVEKGIAISKGASDAHGQKALREYRMKTWMRIARGLLECNRQRSQQRGKARTTQARHLDRISKQGQSIGFLREALSTALEVLESAADVAFREAETSAEGEARSRAMEDAAAKARHALSTSDNEHQAARDWIEELLQKADLWDFVVALASDECDSVTIIHPNPEFDPGRDYAIHCEGFWVDEKLSETRWFEGDSYRECFEKALKAKEEAPQ